MSIAGDITAIRDWANVYFYTKEKINDIFINGLDAFNLREPLYERVVKTSQSSIYTATKKCKVLAFNLETIGEANSNVHRSSADISTTGTVLSTVNLTSDFDNSNRTRDTQICFKIIQLSIGDTITFTNSSVTSYSNRIHMIFDLLNTVFTGLESVDFHSYIDTYATQYTKTITDSSCYLLIDADITNSNISSSFYNIDVDSEGNSFSTGRFIGSEKNAVICFKETSEASGDEVSMLTSNVSSYASKVFAVIKLIKSS